MVFKRACRNLGELLPELNLPAPLASLPINGMAIDSRQIQQGEVFVALIGERVNGRQFVGNAIANGAVAILLESTLNNKAGTVDSSGAVPIISVANLADRVSELAGRCYGYPSLKLNVIGVTGTNGKSTCVSLISQLHEHCAGKAATIGTLGVGYDGQWRDLGMTTPDPASCQRILADLLCEQVDLVAMEVSSHGLDQNRVAGIQFNSAVFTNLTHDHLDYHSNFEHYAAAKQKLFEIPTLKNAIINLDDPFAGQIVDVAKAKAKVFTYSLLHFVADVYATDIQYFPHGAQFHITTPWGETDIYSPLLGEFNIYNLLASLTVLLANGHDLATLVAATKSLEIVPGRMQRIDAVSDITMVVDYAHTPDALAQAIAATRAHALGDLWLVFGCGGDRDPSKRAAMAKVAERFADQIIVTSDNPRSESPEKIIAEICSGFVGGGYHTVTDREEAIHFATQTAKSGDIILLAGKGHENYQIIGDQKLPFDDFLVGRQALHERKSVVLEGDEQ